MLKKSSINAKNTLMTISRSKTIKKTLSTIRIIASVAGSKPKLFENTINLIMNYESNIEDFDMPNEKQVDKIAKELLIQNQNQIQNYCFWQLNLNYILNLNKIRQKHNSEFFIKLTYFNFLQLESALLPGEISDV